MRRRVLKDQDESTTIYCDNKTTIALSKNHVFHKRTKHIDTRYHFVRELVNNGEISLEYCRLADIFTKALAKEKNKYLRDQMDVVKFNVINDRN